MEWKLTGFMEKREWEEKKRLGGISLGSRVQKSAKAKQDAGSYGF